MQVLTNGNSLTRIIEFFMVLIVDTKNTIPWAFDYNLDAIVQYIQQKFPKSLGQMQK